MSEYENKHVFLEYAKMERSKNGLKRAGESHCKYASDHEAKEILSI